MSDSLFKPRALLERLVGMLALLLFLPPLLLFALFLRANSDAAILITDRFIGKSLRPVQRYRFRTTGTGTEAFRVVGRWLRTFSFDELPGLLSVARGECGLMDVLGSEVHK